MSIEVSYETMTAAAGAGLAAKGILWAFEHTANILLSGGFAPLFGVVSGPLLFAALVTAGLAASIWFVMHKLEKPGSLAQVGIMLGIMVLATMPVLGVLFDVIPATSSLIGTATTAGTVVSCMGAVLTGMQIGRIPGRVLDQRMGTLRLDI